MARLSPSEVALEGFRLVRERPRSVLVWGGVLLAFQVALVSLIWVGGWGEALNNFGVQFNPAKLSPEQAMELFRTILPAYGVIIVGGLLIGSVLNCAVFRCVFTPANTTGAALRLGPDELRQIGVNLVGTGLMMMVLFLVSFVAGLVAGIVAAIVPQLSPAVGFLVFLVSFWALVLVAVRVSLMAPLAFIEQKINPVRAWYLTRGHFWDLSGAYFLAVVFALLVYVLGLVVTFAVVAIAAGGDLEAVKLAGQPDWSSLRSLIEPLALLSAVLSALMMALLVPLMVAPAAVACRELVQDDRH